MVDLRCKQEYETTMSEWMAVEAIIRQKDRETMAANLAKLSSESTSGGDAPPPPTPSNSKVLSQELSNDVRFNTIKNINCKTLSMNYIVRFLKIMLIFHLMKITLQLLMTLN